MPAQLQTRTGSLHLGWNAAIAVWIVCVAGMLWWITDYEFSTYETSTDKAVSHWPSDTSLRLSTERPTLVFFMHPKCPCTRASLNELRKLLEASTVVAGELPEVIVVASQPRQTDASWSETGTVRDAALLPRAIVFTDVDGLESERFGAVTSGTVMMFDTTGNRLFAGGITTSRGHEGDSAGGVMLRHLLNGEIAGMQPVVPTFGCKLCSREDGPEQKANCHADCVAPLP